MFGIKIVKKEKMDKMIRFSVRNYVLSYRKEDEKKRLGTLLGIKLIAKELFGYSEDEIEKISKEGYEEAKRQYVRG